MSTRIQEQTMRKVSNTTSIPFCDQDVHFLDLSPKMGCGFVVVIADWDEFSFSLHLTLYTFFWFALLLHNQFVLPSVRYYQNCSNELSSLMRGVEVLWSCTCSNGPRVRVRRILHTTVLSTHVPRVMLYTLDDCSEIGPIYHRISSFGTSSTHCKPCEKVSALRCFRDDRHG